MPTRASGNHDGVWSATSALEARDRQQRLWQLVLRTRYVAIAALVVAALLPVGSGRWWKGMP